MVTYLHRNSYNHNGEDQSTKCPVSKHLRKWQGKNKLVLVIKMIGQNIHGKLEFSQVCYTNKTNLWTKLAL